MSDQDDDKQYYCVPCENGEDFYQMRVSTDLYRATVNEDGDVMDNEYVQNFSDEPSELQPGVYCLSCDQVVQKIVAPAKEGVL